MTSRGIIFFASGRKYIDEALASLRRSARHNPVPHTLFCSEAPGSSTVATTLRFAPTKNVWLDRIECLRATPYELNIYLDVDCVVLAPILELFDLLANYEIAAAS